MPRASDAMCACDLLQFNAARPTWGADSCSACNHPPSVEDQQVLNKYSLRHGGHANEGPLRNWELQGSDDGETWVTLRVHVNDESLKGEYGVASWDVEPGAAFRLFRVFDITAAPVQLSVGGLELYGRLELSYPSATSPRNTPPPPK